MCPGLQRSTEHEHVLKGEQQYSGHSYMLHVGIKDRGRVRENKILTIKLNRDEDMNGSY